MSLGSARLTEVSGGGGNADADAYIAAAGITDAAFKSQLTVFFASTAAVRAKLDFLYLWANQSATAARTDLILPSRAILVVNKQAGFFDNGMGGEDYYETFPIFTPWRGYAQTTLDGGNYTGFSTPVINFSTAKCNSNAAVTGASVLHYNRTGADFFTLAVGISNFPIDVGFQAANAQMYARFGFGGNMATGSATFPRTGFYAVSATSGNYRFSRNGVITTNGNGTTGQNSTTGSALVILGGGPGQSCLMAMGAALTDAETVSFYNALQTLLTSIGAQA